MHTKTWKHTLLLKSARIKSLDSLNNQPSLFYRSQHYLCILAFPPAVFHSAPPSIRFLQEQEAHCSMKRKLPILSHHRETQIRKWHFAFREAYPKSILSSYQNLPPGLSLFIYLVGCHQASEHNKQLFYFFSSLFFCSESWLRSGAFIWFGFNWQLMNPDISCFKHLAKGKP